MAFTKTESPYTPPPPPTCPVCHEEAHIKYMKAFDGKPVLLSLSGACSCITTWNSAVPEGWFPIACSEWVDDVYSSQITKTAQHPMGVERCRKCGSPYLNLSRWDDVAGHWESPTGICGCVDYAPYQKIEELWKECKSLHRMLYAKKEIARRKEMEDVRIEQAE